MDKHRLCLYFTWVNIDSASILLYIDKHRLCLYSILLYIDKHRLLLYFTLIAEKFSSEPPNVYQ